MKKILFIVYAIFLISLTIFSYLFIDPNLIYLQRLYSGFAFEHRMITAFLYLLIVILFFTFYFLFLLLLYKKILNHKDIKWLIVVTVAILFLSYPAMLSYDIFNYITTSKVLFLYHENPYIIMPIEFIGEPFLSFTRAANKIALYGPFWIVLTRLPFILGLGNFVIVLFNFKLMIALFYLMTLYVIWKLSKDVLAVFIFALNPLVILETIVSSHNDIVMIFLVLLSLLFFKNKKVLYAVILFVLSIFIKYASLMLTPIVIYLLIQTLKKKQVNWDKCFYFSGLLMFAAFLLSPIREEIYPWYAIWFLSFVVLFYQKKMLLKISIALSFGLMLSYIPFMFLGTYNSPTPTIKTLVTFTPVIMVLILSFIKSKLWLKIFSR